MSEHKPEAAPARKTEASEPRNESGAEAATGTETGTGTETVSRPRRQPRYNVVLLDDDDHSYEYVIEMLGKLFGHPQERALQLAKEVDTQKRAILLTTTLEHAEFKQEQVHSYGPDKRIMSSKGAMSCVLEPVVG
jgi:ATP-dependent Clp protease adaptor protein ClpS